VGPGQDRRWLVSYLNSVSRPRLQTTNYELLSPEFCPHSRLAPSVPLLTILPVLTFFSDGYGGKQIGESRLKLAL
jgi:hypothetical protein